MTLSEVENVDVVANSSTIMRSVIIAEDQKFFPLASRNLCKEREKIERDAERIFAHDTRGVTACGIEVAKKSSIPLLYVRFIAFLGSLCAFCADVVSNHQLAGELGVAVGVCRPEGTLFGNGDHVLETGSVAINSSRGGVDDVANIVVLGSSQKGECALNVDAIVVEWDLSGFTNSLQSSKVDNTVNLGVLLEDLVETFLVCNVDVVVYWLLSTDALNSIQDLLGRVVEVVNNHDFVAGFEEGKDGEGANVACATATESALVSPGGSASVPSDQAVSYSHLDYADGKF